MKRSRSALPDGPAETVPLMLESPGRRWTPGAPVLTAGPNLRPHAVPLFISLGGLEALAPLVQQRLGITGRLLAALNTRSDAAWKAID